MAKGQVSMAGAGFLQQRLVGQCLNLKCAPEVPDTGGKTKRKRMPRESGEEVAVRDENHPVQQNAAHDYLG
jgi:hypothetical protein